MKRYIFILFLAFTSFITAQSLQLEKIMKGDSFIGNQPDNQYWSIDGKTIYFDWNPNNEIGNSKYYWNTSLSKPEIVPENEFDFSSIDATSQKEFNTIYYTKNGNLYSYDKKTKQLKKVLVATERIYSVERSANPNIIFYQQNRNLYQLNTSDFSLLQITNFKSGSETPKEKETEDYLTQQQTELFQFIRDTKAKNDWYDKKNEAKKK